MTQSTSPGQSCTSQHTKRKQEKSLVAELSPSAA